MPALLTPIGRLAFCHLFEPWAGDGGGEPRYQAALIFDPVAQKSPEYQALKQAVFDCGIAEWGEAKMRDGNFFKTLRMPFRAAGEKDYEGFEEGFTWINPRSKNRPGVVDARRQDITVPDDVWSGQLARFFVNPFAYEVHGNRGVSFGLNHVQITRRDMPRLDGRMPASRAFTDVEEEGAPSTDSDLPF